MRVFRMFVGLVLFLWFAALPSSVTADNAEGRYFEGLRYLKQKQWQKAEQAFKRTFELLEQKTAPKGQPTHLLTLGQCDVLFLRAQAAEGAKQPQRMCQLLQDFSQRFSQVPKDWKTWSVNPVLPSRIEQASAMFARCKDIPTLIDFEVVPKDATLEAFLPAKSPDTSASWVPFQKRLALLQERVMVRVQAKGYVSFEKTYRPRRWYPQRFVIKLKPLPKPATLPAKRLAILRRPPPPVKKGPSVGWIVGGSILGVAVAGGVIALVLVLVLPRENAGQTNVTFTSAPVQ